MPDLLLDNPLVNNVMFHPRSAIALTSNRPYTHDGIVPTPDGEEIGYRLYDDPKAEVLIVFFHGNGEIAADYEGIAPMFFAAGAALLIADFRGYGWSTGKPTGSKLLPDGEAVVDGLERVLQKHDVKPKTRPIYVMGRSLGSAPATHIARRYQDRFAGLIIESGFASGRDWLTSKAGLASLFKGVKDPFPNAENIADTDLPLLVIHGEHDTLIPPDHGKRLYDASTHADKTLLIARKAGHNDLLMVATNAYFDHVKRFVSG